jgi:general secretion pathway protein K
MRTAEFKSPARQTGTVLITVVLIAAFVIVLVIQSVKTVRFQKQLSSNLINRDQAYSYLMGMEELAKIWLKKAFDNEKGETVHLNQPWAQDNITFPIDGGMMIASIRDMQSCFNLNSVAVIDNNPGNNQQGGDLKSPNPVDDATPERDERDPADPYAKTLGQEIFEELVHKISDDTQVTGQALATALRDWIDADIDPAGPDGAEDGYYQGMAIPYRTANSPIAHISELRAMKDFGPAIYEKLTPFVCVLPDENVVTLNVNTIAEDAVVLLEAALGGKVTASEISQALSKRGEEGFEDIQQFLAEFGEKKLDKYAARLGVTSEYFEVSSQAEIGKTRVALKTLFKKEENNQFKVVSRYYGKE